MLRSLTIKNLALIEETHVTFGPTFNVITGESGAGKSSLLSALRFALGQRSDTSYIREGAGKASILAVFESADARPLLEAAGIDCEGAEITIKRELLSNGTSKAFINNQPVLLSTLEAITKELIHFTSQQAKDQLTDASMQQKMLDLFAHVDLTAYQEHFLQLKEKQEELATLKSQAGKKDFLLKKLYEKRELLKQAPLLEQEKEIFIAYKEAVDQESQKENLQKLHDDLFSPEKNLLSKLYRYSTQLTALSAIATSLKTIHTEMTDLSYTLESLLTKRGKDSGTLESELTTIDRIKAIWSPSVIRDTEKEIETLENMDQILEDLEEEIAFIEEKVRKLAANITEKRTKASAILEKKISSELESLHMKSALFHVDLVPATLSLQGAEKVEFLLTANKGERKTALKGFASGGELSRLFLALKSLIAGACPVLIFDEIDAAIGGMTAVSVAAKLKALSTSQQVICITHLPQMAEQAASHLMIEKYALDGRTFTKVTPLSATGRAQELKRMLGQTL